MILSPHFTLAELSASEVAERHGANNTPPERVLPALIYLAQNLEAVRSLLGHYPVHINSGYRSERTNVLVGGREFSQHTRGEAADFIVPRAGTPFELCTVIAQSPLPFDQLIYEFSWVHISFTTRRVPRRSILTIRGSHTWAGLVQR